MSPFPGPARPRSVTITLWSVFLLGTWNAGRAIMLGRQREMLLDVGAFPDPRLRQIIFIVWTVLFWTLLVALWQKQPVARQVTPFALIFYSLFELGFAFFFVQTPLARDAWLLNAIFYLSMVSFAFWALNRSAAKSYFLDN